MAYQLDPTKVVIWQAGRPAEIWLSHRKLVRNIIRQYKLKPLPTDAYPYYQTPGQMAEFGVDLETAALKKAGKRARWIWPIPFPGGIRIPHLHFGGDVYLVERGQWAEFSEHVVADLRQRLKQANEISFEQTLALNEAVTAIR